MNYEDEQKEAQRVEAEKKEARQQWFENYIKIVEKTDQNIFRVGEYDFEPIWDEANSPSKNKYGNKESKWFIAAMTQKFHCEIHAKTTQIDALKKEEILSEHNTDGLLKIKFDFQGLYLNGFPKAEVNVVGGRIERKHNCGFSISGHHYQHWKFFGKIFIDEKGIKIFGNFDSSPFRSLSFETTKYPVNIQVAFDAQDLDWSNYKFTTSEELATASSELVTSISLKGIASIATIPESFKDYKKLKTLELGYMNTTTTKIALTTLPEWFGELENLEDLRISSSMLTELPQVIAKLQKLKRLHITDTQLQTVPEGIWQLPNLEYLNLSSNQLTEMPFDINLPNLKALSFQSNQLTRLVDGYNLPNLESLNFEDNQLKSLLTSFAKLPKLKSLYMKGNPLTSLSESFSEIEHLDVEIEFKNKFLDFEYKGADGKGTVAWDDKVFYAQHDTELMKGTEYYWKNELMQANKKDLSKLMKKSLIFTLGEPDTYKQLGYHRIGGMPDLPKNLPYPRFGKNLMKGKEDFVYEFIAQINCRDVAHLQDYLPKTGILYFFLSNLDDVQDAGSGAKVIYFDGDFKTLQSGKQFGFKREDYYWNYADEPYKAYQANAEIFVDFGGLYSINQNEYILEGLSEAFKDRVKEDSDFGSTIMDSFEIPKVDGVTINTYGYAWDLNPEHEVALEHKGKPLDWVVLMRVPSVGDFQWNDAGDLFFVIHKSDLAKGDFSNVICTMYSS